MIGHGHIPASREGLDKRPRSARPNLEDCLRSSLAKTIRFADGANFRSCHQTGLIYESILQGHGDVRGSHPAQWKTLRRKSSVSAFQIDRRSRNFLIALSAAYITLAVWCSLDADGTSDAVGFRVMSGSGKSEFLTVYGGLQFGLGLVFLIAVIEPDATGLLLTISVVLHGSLVVFRSASFLLFSTPGRATYVIAFAEWLILILSVLLIIDRRKQERLWMNVADRIGESDSASLDRQT